MDMTEPEQLGTGRHMEAAVVDRTTLKRSCPPLANMLAMLSEDDVT